MPTRISNIDIAQAFLSDKSDQDLRQMVGAWLGQFPDAEAGLRHLKALKKSVILFGSSKGQNVKGRADRVFALIANDYGSLWTCDRAPGRPTESPSGKPRENVTVRLDPDLREAAKAHHLKLGPLLEDAITQALTP
jgi:hypothetical protein